MGFFSKKTYVCEKCGKVFEKRFNLNGDLCDDCYNEEISFEVELSGHVRGYCEYASKLWKKEYSVEEKQKILARRDALMENLKVSGGITKEELQEASDHYKRLSDAEALDVLKRASRSEITTTSGAAYADGFFAPTQYDGMIVDAKDVFAVGFRSDYKFVSGTNEVILCAVFTNDPYVPVFPMIFLGKLGTFEIFKSKKGRDVVKVLFSIHCPNLQYPVSELNDLKKMIKSGEHVKGNISRKEMLGYISDISLGRGMFNSENMHSELPSETEKVLAAQGYIRDEEVNEILQMDKMFHRNYWNKQMEKLVS